MKQGKRWIALMLALAMCLSVLPASVLATELGSEAETTEVAAPEDSSEATEAEEPQVTETEDPDEEPVEDVSPSTMAATSGKCGKNVTWKLDRKGTLTISGKGEMYDLSRKVDNWYPSRDSWEPSCKKIESIVIKNGVTSIGRNAFWFCENLTKITIPDSMTKIGGEAFDNCTRLTKVTIPKNVVSIEDRIFSHCDSLTDITVANGNKNYSSENGVLYNKGKTSLLRYPAGKKGAYIIPAGVTEIASSAFHDCERLTGVIIPEGVTSVGEYAFCLDRITSIVIPESMTSMDDAAFSNCSKLKKIYFKGNAPTLIEDDGTIGFAKTRYGTFADVTATAYYPENDPTWTSDKRKDYGGNITWKTWNPVFDAAVYQADYMLQHDNGYEEDRMFQEVSPSKTFYEAGEKQGLTSSIKSWKAVTNALDMMDKPSTLLDVGFERKDMYSAVVLSMFEADSKKSHTVVRYSDQAVKWSGKLLGYLKKAMKLKYNIELTKTYDLSKLTKVQKQSLFAMANEWMENQDTLLKKAINGVDIAGKVMQYVKEFSSWCDYVASCSMLVSLDCYNKQLVKEMYQEATNADLKAALKDCITIMDSDPVELYLAELSKLGKKTVKVMVQQGLDAGWKVTKAAAAKVNPYVAWIWISYNESKALCNALFNTDKISENYCKMEVLLQVEKVLLAVYKDAKSACETELNHDHAELLIHAYRLLYNCFDVDCQYALNFVNAVDKAVASRIARALKRKDREALKAQIADIRQNTEQTYWSSNNAWIEELSSTHPEEYPKYQNWERYQLAAVQITISPAKSTYTGKKLEPKVSVLDNLVKKNTKLKEGEDYAISYDNNKNVGTATVTVVGNSIYYGEVTKTFDIIPKGVSSVTVSNQKGKKLKVSWKPNKSVNGYEIQYALDKNYQKAKKTTVKKAKETGKVIGGLKKNKKYYVRVRTYQKASGKTYYSAWSKTKTVTIKK